MYPQTVSAMPSIQVVFARSKNYFSSALVFVTSIVLLSSCTRTATEDAGNQAQMRGIEIPPDWTDVSYYSASNYQEFVAKGDQTSWEEWCSENHMHNAMESTSRSLKLLFVEVDFSYTAEDTKGLLARRSKAKADGGNRKSWFDPDNNRVVYKESFW